jgi:hypothetical protein
MFNILSLRNHPIRDADNAEPTLTECLVYHNRPHAAILNLQIRHLPFVCPIFLDQIFLSIAPTA